MNYYNEIDLSARRWLRELIRDGLIPDGDIDERPIQEVRAEEITRGGYSQCHFFAGVGGWPFALRIAGVPDDEPLWTGSCPCQPFSDSGEQMGFRDPRHLFPTWRRLIARCGPAKVYGEQVASKLGREWLARVRLEMASLGYAARGSDLCSAGVAAPNLRQRLYWLADTESERRKQGNTNTGGSGQGKASPEKRLRSANSGELNPVANANNAGREGRRLRPYGDEAQRSPWESGTVGIVLTDGTTRRIKPEIFPLAARLPGDLGLIRGAGNAINPWIAAEFIRAAINT